MDLRGRESPLKQYLEHLILKPKVLKLSPVSNLTNLFYTCTANLKFSRHHLKELCMWTEMSVSWLGLRNVSSLVQRLCNVQMSPCVIRESHCLEDSQQESRYVGDVVWLLHALFCLPIIAFYSFDDTEDISKYSSIDIHAKNSHHGWFSNLVHIFDML